MGTIWANNTTGKCQIRKQTFIAAGINVCKCVGVLCGHARTFLKSVGGALNVIQPYCCSTLRLSSVAPPGAIFKAVGSVTSSKGHSRYQGRSGPALLPGQLRSFYCLRLIFLLWMSN